jgi:hypothetical protein
MPSYDRLLILRLRTDVPRATPRDLDPGLGGQRTSAKHKHDGDGGVDRVQDSFFESLRRGHVVGDSTDGSELG